MTSEEGRSVEEISSTSSEKELPLSVGDYCLHRSWGFGLIQEISLDADSVIIDFQGKPRHRMQWEYALQSLELVPRDHILVLKAEKLSTLREQAASDPLAIVELCVRSLGEGATVEALQETLTPAVVAGDEWKKWWDGVRRIMRREGRFEIPTRKNQPIRIASSASPAWQKSLEELEHPASGKSAVEAARVLAKAGELPPGTRERAISAIDEILSSANGPSSGETLELAVLRDELLKAIGKAPEEGVLALSRWLPGDDALLRKILCSMSGSAQKEVLRRLVLERGGAVSVLLDLLPTASARTADAIVTVLTEAGRANDLLERLQRGIQERTIGSEVLAWICRTRDELFRPLFRPDLFFCILYLLERESNGVAKKGSKLYELLTGKLELLHAILADAPVTDARDVARAALASPVLRELDKRSLLGAIIKKHPGVQELVAGDQQKNSEASLIVSWKSLARKKQELETLLTKQIPENTREIAVARSYGDLRENHEYKAAKEMQGVLLRRKAELEAAIARARGTDFSEVATDSVNVGTRVVLKDLATGEERRVTILGAWDSDPAAGVVSYLAGLGQTLLGRKPGDEVELPAEGEEKGAIVRVERIEPVGPIPA
ncbi:Transcription elongation factor GreA [Methylacidimicrobium cyclopophantes]|uniref:Transcription elongation factor GreA n=1 Tax=Methylacidimicrobium cyclopophantes TaxID=1041766 RepID=A0A5E6M879_9BACT|nr:GreA/GreB family elongation factor [Methylacidimicrobium cyclopophantes]VVM05385.1 Transcription elongation factor GreA [Methylacidimicrobium cyclopophantes]